MKEKLFFKDSKGNKVSAILSEPADDKKTIIILCHGFTSNKNRTTYLRLEENLNKYNIDTLRFDFYGHGESDGKFEDITTSKAADDVLSAIKFVKEKGYEKIGLFGASFGGMASLVAASLSKEIYILALKCPVSDILAKIIADISKSSLEEWKNRGYIYYTNPIGKKFKLNYSFYEDAKNINGKEIAEKIKIPTLIVHGDADITVPVAQSIKTSKLIEDCKLEIIKGADHPFSKKKDFNKMLKLIIDFIVKNS